MPKFFVDRDSDEGLEADNEAFWEALLGRIEEDFDRGSELRVLDVGSHRGGLLERVASRWSVGGMFGVEPHEPARSYAERRLSGRVPQVSMLTPEEWDLIPDGLINLVTCHEVLYLLEDRAQLLSNLRRVLAPRGAAYIVHGCHPESPIWEEWSTLMRAHGINVFEHSPLSLLEGASKAGLSASVRPLRRDGWIRYDPTRATYRFSSSAALFDHHYRHKLLFRLVRSR